MALQIKFSHTWDKLQDGMFTTIRSWTGVKEEYYRSNVGNVFRVVKTDLTYPYHVKYGIKTAHLLGVKVVVPKDLDPLLLETDVRLNGTVNEQWLNNLMKMKKALLLTFSDRDMTHLLGDISEIAETKALLKAEIMTHELRGLR